MNTPARRAAALTLLTLASLFFAGCSTTRGTSEEIEPPVIDPVPAAPIEAAAPAAEPAAAAVSKQVEGEVPLAVAESEHPDQTQQAPREVIVEGHRSRDEAIHD